MRVEFSVSPWLLVLIVPAIAAIAAAFFIGGRNGRRRTVNRILSAALQSIVATLCIFAASGICLTGEKENPQSELVVLVDKSFTIDGASEEADEYLSEVFGANAGKCKIAVALFGRDCKVALSLGAYSGEEGFNLYKSAAKDIKIDDGATDISSALLAAFDPATSSGLIENPGAAKILIISDGLETDGDALGTIGELTRAGIRVDTAFFSGNGKSDASVTGTIFPDDLLFKDKNFTLKVRLKSSFPTSATIFFEDVDEAGNRTEKTLDGVKIKEGEQEISVPYKFSSSGLHRLAFKVEAAGNAVAQNDIYCSYYDVAGGVKTLIIEKYDGESSRLNEVIAAGGDVDIERISAETACVLSLSDLSEYNEVILYNVSAADMTEEFQSALASYAEGGGGVLTVGGFEKSGGEVVTEENEDDPEKPIPLKHGYNEDDADSVYASMLPVSIEPYVPSVGVVYVFDVSDSMTSTGAAIHTAVDDARHSLDLLNKRDYVGIVMLEESYRQVGELLPMTKRTEIEKTLDEVEDTHGNTTNYGPALQQAVDMLGTCPNGVKVKHIVLLSDGAPSDSLESYGKIIQDAHDDQGITITVMTYYKHLVVRNGKTYYYYHDATETGAPINVENMTQLAQWGGGSCALTPRSAHFELDKYMQSDMKLDQLEEKGLDAFSPKIGAHSDSLGSVTDSELAKLTLGGFFPSQLKLYGGAEALLLADASPLYAEWKFGKGKVGSFMIDLEGFWSEDLLSSETGKTLIADIFSHILFDVRKEGELEPTITESNFTTRVNVYGFDGTKKTNEKLVAFVEDPIGGTIGKFDLKELSASGNRFAFENEIAGTYTIYIVKVANNFDINAVEKFGDIPASGIIDMAVGYRTFSYSSEYADTADTLTDGQKLLSSLSTRKTEADAPYYEKFVYDAQRLFDEFCILHYEFDLRPTLLITALVLYIAGVAFRKFKIGKRKSG